MYPQTLGFMRTRSWSGCSSWVRSSAEEKGHVALPSSIAAIAASVPSTAPGSWSGKRRASSSPAQLHFWFRAQPPCRKPDSLGGALA